ncbi:hypothetical protein G8759_25090 [Spirosoma aureum]|uniref:Uncharacterized protein n=1 Tax=Spirosoma aureum TaxID=2692134 RepID=A0A6G9AT59_9BACT|nr:hypothetical protein [Spirosoma aureum]QIP15672.1 hypothetical protein G8759_25090 [Spirosoma aureum]
MKKLILIMVLVYCKAFGQSQFADTVKISDLAPPSSPAFVLLDAAPSSIEKPATAKAFTASVINLINNNGGAAEFTPYWLVRRSNMTSFRYLGIKEDKQGELYQRSIASAKLISISLAVLNKNNTDEKAGKSVSNIVLGARTRLFQINKKSAIDTVIKYHRIIVDSLARLNSSIADVAIEYQLKMRDINDKNEIVKLTKERNNKIKALQAGHLKNTKSQSDTIRKFLTEKPAFTVDIAGAVNYAFDTTRLSSGRFDRVGAWANINWIPIRNDKEQRFLHTIGVLRYLTNDKLVIDKEHTEYHSYFDFGGKVEGEFKRFSIGFEYVRRLDITNKDLNSDRAAGVLNYRIADNVFLTGTFGKNFGLDNSLLTLFGLQFNFSNEKVVIKQ